MQQARFRRGDLVEVRSPAEILATLDDRGMLEGLPFMPEMLRYVGRRFVVAKRADKVCDTICGTGSRRLPDAVLLEDLRCDGSGHDGCQAECRLFWKEAWLRRVDPGDPAPTLVDADDYARLARLVGESTKHSTQTNGKTPVTYSCQNTELFRASPQHLPVWDPRPYVREYTLGNVGLPTFVRVMARAALYEPLRKLGFLKGVAVRGTGSPSKTRALGLQPGDLVRVKSKEEIAATLTPDGRNRGLWFDREMLPFCGGTYRVRQRVRRFIDERSAQMIELKTDAVTLDGAVCSGERSTIRWFCPRAIYPYWREGWLQRVEEAD
jgi:hypothetical protein